jgi:hypothetical protein
VPFTERHAYLTLHGTIANRGSVDEWQCGLRLLAGVPENPSDTALSALATACAADVEAYWVGGQANGLRSLYTSSTTLDFVKVATIGFDGKYLNDDAPVVSMPAQYRAGGKSGPNPMPSALAMAVTLLTPSARGLASKGRIYLPGPASDALTGSGGLNDATVELAGNLTAQLLNALSANNGFIPAATCTPVVMSRTRTGLTRVISGVAVGRRWDVQRRRSEKISEAPFTSATVVD